MIFKVSQTEGEKENLIGKFSFLQSEEKEKKKNRNLETNLDFTILQRQRNFAHFPMNFHKDWKNMEMNHDSRNQL
jgi:hypothetical protein